MENSDTYFKIRKSNEDQKIVYGLVYEPYTLDTYGDMMLPEAIEKMAHEYIKRKDLDKTIDINHNNVSTTADIVESFIARKGDPEYTEGAWVLGVKIHDDAVWGKIKSGELAGFSMEVLCKQYPVVVSVLINPTSIGVTEEADGHKHYFYAEVNDEGVVVGGRTSNDAGHTHEIRRGTATEMAYGHKHRFSIE